jgi:hypothetical protein
VRIRSTAACVLSAAAFAAIAAPTEARGASLGTSYPCYAEGESALLNGSGFTPDGRVTLSVSGQQIATLTADPDGAFTVRVETGLGMLGLERLRFTAADRTDQTLTAGVTVRIAATDVLVTPSDGSPHRMRRIRAWGFIGSGTVYAHVKRRGHRRARNIALGSPRGACGTLDVRRRLFPRDARPGSYKLQFDTIRRYIPDLEPSVSYDVAVQGPVFGAGRSSVGYAAGPSTMQTASDRPFGLPPITFR